MSDRDSPLGDVVSPQGSDEGKALWNRVADFIRGKGGDSFGGLTWDVFRFQYENNPVYRQWCIHLGWNAERLSVPVDWQDLPTLPVEAFKWTDIRTEGVADVSPPLHFRTSGTTGVVSGVHHVFTPELYRLSVVQGFRSRFGAPGEKGAVVLGLLPGYLERPDSSLVHMVRVLREEGWMEPQGTLDGGFHLHDFEELFRSMEAIMESGRKVLLIGVTWALVDAAEAWRQSGRLPLGDRVEVSVTGGMKGRREEWVAERVRATLKEGFGLAAVGGEYGMTELLSQAWSKANGVYETPPWMRIRLRRIDDPLSLEPSGATGGVDVVDLANLGSCSFLSTQDLARPCGAQAHEFSFELLGRFDRSEVRGCNLMVQ